MGWTFGPTEFRLCHALSIQVLRERLASAFGNSRRSIEGPEWGALLPGRYRPHFGHPPPDLDFPKAATKQLKMESGCAPMLVVPIDVLTSRKQTVRIWRYASQNTD